MPTGPSWFQAPTDFTQSPQCIQRQRQPAGQEGTPSCSAGQQNVSGPQSSGKQSKVELSEASRRASWRRCLFTPRDRHHKQGRSWAKFCFLLAPAGPRHTTQH